MKKLFVLLTIGFAITFLSQLSKIFFVSLSKKSNCKVDLPDTMDSAYVHIDNGIENIAIKKNIKLPQIADNDILVLVKTASFSQMDFNVIAKKKNKKDESGFAPCSDFAGIVVAVGKNVNIYKIGDKVFGISDVEKRDGACAQYVAVPENNVYSMPYSLSFQQAASIPTPALLNWIAIQDIKAQKTENNSVLIDDAISETGVTLSGMLIRNGYNVTAIDNIDAMKYATSLGIKKFISNEQYLKNKNEYYGKFDVVIDLQHGLSANQLVNSVKPNGLFVSFENVKINRDDIRMSVIDLQSIDRETFAKIGRLVHLGKLQVKIAKEYDLKNVSNAYLDAKRENLDGKVVINIK